MQRLCAAAPPALLSDVLSGPVLVGTGSRFRCSKPPTIRFGVPDNLSLRCPTRWRWRRPRGRSITGSITGRSITGWAPVVVVVPVTAVIPVRVRAPALVPRVARAPVMVICGCRRRRCLGNARGQSECGQGHAASRQRASAQAKPRFCLLVDIHFLRIPLKKVSKTPSDCVGAMKCSSHVCTNHLVKTFWGWGEKQLPHGTLILTSPAGRTHVTTPGSALLFPSLCHATGDFPAPHSGAPAPKPRPPHSHRTPTQPNGTRSPPKTLGDLLLRIARCRR